MQEIKQMEKECPMKGRMSQCRVDDICIHNLYIKDDILQKDEKTDMQDIKQQFYETVNTHNPKHLRLIKDLLIADWWIEKINLAVEQEKERVLAMVMKEIEETKTKYLEDSSPLGAVINGYVYRFNQSLDTLKEKLQAKQ